MARPIDAPDRPKGNSPFKLGLAIVSVAIGALILITGVFTLNFPTILVGIALGLPGAWWLLHERKAKSGAPMKRHWGVVSAVSAAALIGGGAMMPDQDASTATPDSETTVTTTSTAATRSTTPTTTSALRTTTRAPEPTTEEPAAETLPDVSAMIDDFLSGEERSDPDPAPAYTPDPAPAPVVEQPAPAPAPVVEQPAPTGRVVTPGAFCKDVETGTSAQTATGLTVTCTRAVGEERSRWRA